MSLIDDFSDFDALSFGHVFYLPVSQPIPDRQPDVIFGSPRRTDFEENLQVIGRAGRFSHDSNRSGLIV